ncbi:MAG: hypothetical protein C0620_08600 [Desulfuromonas sp.]|nr:MAG: hypothetical protein C0620_08600 [Desulfuromonas sp.]
MMARVWRPFSSVERLVLVLIVTAVLSSCLLYGRAYALGTQQKPLDMLYNAADSDGNGLISESEWHTVMQRRFEEIDTNDDGQVSLDEMAASRETTRERFRAMRQAR